MLVNSSSKIFENWISFLTSKVKKTLSFQEEDSHELGDNEHFAFRNDDILRDVTTYSQGMEEAYVTTQRGLSPLNETRIETVDTDYPEITSEQVG